MDYPQVQWNKRYEEMDQLWISEPDSALVETLGLLRPGRALDLGCGEGRNALHLARNGWEVTAVDFSEVALDRLKAASTEGELNIDIVCEDFNLYIQRVNKKFDLVVVANIHPASEERFKMYSQIRDLVNPGGHIFIIGHHLDSLGQAGPHDPDRLLSEAEIEKAFLGFELKVLTKVVNIADHGHESPSLVALVRAPA